MTSPFEFVNAINGSKEDLFTTNGYGEKDYVRFIINRAFSYFPDTVMIANCANEYLNEVPARAHFNFYRAVVPQGRRFSKWAKGEATDTVALIMKHYNYSQQKAEEAERVLSREAIEELKRFYNTGGRSK